MPLLNPTFFLGVLVLLYLSSFVLFAVLRIVTGLSIQRIGYFSLRRLAYTPRDGCRVEIRGLGFTVHRPTFAQPTWVSLVINELVVTVDLKELDGHKTTGTDADQDGESSRSGTGAEKAIPEHKSRPTRRNGNGPDRSETWKRLTNLKEKIKKLHRKVKLLRMVDVVATNSAVNVVGVGTVQVGSFTVAVDTRRKMVDRARFVFQRSRSQPQERQAEWIMTVRSVLFTADGNESLEVLDHAMLNIHGFLYDMRDGLRDATLALKLGRLHIPFDDVELCRTRYMSSRKKSKSFSTDDPIDIYLGDVMQEAAEPGSTTEELMRTVSDSKEFFSSILRGIKEVQFAVGFLGLTKKIDTVKPAAVPMQLTAAMKEVGIDLHRLDTKSPAHRMYFPSKDVAHEALAAALSISVGLDDGHGKPDRLVYIPMATTTVRTTLPSKTVELAQDGSAEEKNANIMFANSVVTSPSVDLDPRHLPLLIALLRGKPKPPRAPLEKRRTLIPRLLPKANIKFSMHEPVVRIRLKPLQKTEDPDDFDLIISSISSISLDVESSHSFVEESHYALNGSMRLQSHQLYYQTNEGERFNLITTDSFDLKVHLAASPDLSVDASGNVQSFSISMVRPEITDGLRQIVKELRIDVEPDKKQTAVAVKQQNFLRSMPQWLTRFQVEATDFNVEVAGADNDISDDTRGISLHLDAVAADYREHKAEGLQRRMPRTRTHSRSITQSDSDLTSPPPSHSRAKRYVQNVGDGRRLAFNARGIEAQILESADRLEIVPFVSVPRIELAFSASSDAHGPMFHVQSLIRTISVQYSLYRHYSVGVAMMTLRRAFMKTGQDVPRPKQQSTAPSHLAPPSTSGLYPDADGLSTVVPELLTVDVKASLVQIKAEMPHDPIMMLHIYGLETGRHRWSTPYVASKLVRLYVEPPRMRNVWARLLSIKGGRIDYRTSKQKASTGKVTEEKMVDITSDAVRFGVPHEVEINRVTDNCINVIKAVQQLHHRFKTGTNEYILEKHPEGPKLVPKVSLRTRNFLFELEDGAFEWKLGMIYRTGKMEQMQRIAREEAFKAKMKRVRDEESRRGSSRARSRSTYTRGRGDQAGGSWFRSRSLDATSPPNSGHGFAKDSMPRYNPDVESSGINGQTKVSEEEARFQLDMHNSQTWKKRINSAYQMSRNSASDMRSTFWGHNNLPDDIEETENILEVPQRPALMAAMVTDLRVVVDKPTFPLSELPNFLHRVGKGMPLDTQYSLLVPMHVSIDMDEARVTLRDYPLPLVHIPALKTGQSSKAQSVSLKTNFVIAEEFRGTQSTRHAKVNVVPPSKNANPTNTKQGGFAIEVRRTIGPVKTYSEVYMDINTALPTRVTWSPCYQPAIQDMMMVIESFTKPQVDPSERVGFWDKLRLVFHSRLFVAWKGDGDLHLALKGTRDPYNVTREGAGFLMCWRNNVSWSINAEDDPKRFMVADSGEYVLAVPDFSHQIRDAARRQQGEDVFLSEDSSKTGAVFKKVVMKLSGKVQWVAGLTFERAIEDGKRSFEFKPHYDVVLKNPHFAGSEGGLPYDAMRGFRSRHIHLSIAVRAPLDRDWMSENPTASTSYNSVHLTPRFFTHFFTWWGLFGQPSSLPIRQGNLFPGREKNSKKFGRHLATVKYNLLLAPLFLSHIYKHKDVEDYSEDAVSATGLKVRFDSFMLDLHQRREEFNTMGRGKSDQSRTSRIKIHAAQLDLASADLRAVSASLKGTTTEAIKRGSISTLITDQDDKPDLSRFTITDHDYSWIDMDDFVELDWILPTEPHPHTKILPLAYAPRLTYFRQTDIEGTIAGDPDRTSPFGDEPTHSCIMSYDDDPKKVQATLIQERLEELAEQMLKHSRSVGEAELKVVRTNGKDPELVQDRDILQNHSGVLREKKTFLERMLRQMEAKRPSSSYTHSHEHRDNSDDSISLNNGTLDMPSGAEFESEFKNRFVVHNMQLKWNNLLRNIVLRYIHQNSQRRGFIYYLSRPAIKFILDIVEEQNRARASRSRAQGKAPSERGRSPGPNSAASDRDRNADQDLEDRLKDILGKDRPFTSASFNTHGDTDTIAGTIEDLSRGISEEFSAQSSYHVRLIAPQIQMQSDKNKKNVVLVTAKGMELKVMEVMDKERISDNVSGLVQRRFLVNMDSTQFFVTHKKWFFTNLVSMYAGSRYGTPKGMSWPPWVPMEIMFDFEADPFGFKRVVQKTSANLRYDKYNTLRLKYNDEVNKEETDEASEDKPTECRMDNLYVEFPQARALCNSSQYYAMYVIVLDLLMYNEPLEKTRSERLEKILLASDFSDLSGAPAKIQRLQERIRQMEEIKTHFQIWGKYLDKKGWEDRLALERDLAACEDELFFVMKAITTSQRKFEVDAESNALLKWNISVRDVVWHLMQDSNEPLVELQLQNLEYDRTDNSDGSHMNLVRVGKVLGLNLVPDAMYPEIIGPYNEGERGSLDDDGNGDMVSVYWHMLEAIAGIPVMDRFEVDLHPMKLQLERDIGKRLFEYIFPGMDSDKPSILKTDSPLNVRDADADEDDAELIDSPMSTPSMDKDSSGFSTRAGSLELRLKPTLTSNVATERSPKKALSIHTGGEGNSHFRLFRGTGGARSLVKRASADSLRASAQPKPPVRSSTTRSFKDGRDATAAEPRRRFGIRSRTVDEKTQSDDLSKMIDRASNYMTFACIKMPAVVLCLSYKGKDQRNFEDVHNFVFKMPAIEWQNKTWSNMDLVLAVKKAVVKALISHTGAIIGNKFSKHRPNAEQRNRLRELANSSVLIPPSTSSGSQQYAGSIHDSDDTVSIYGTSPVDYSRSPPRSIKGSTHNSIPILRPSSRSSSIASGRSNTRIDTRVAPNIPTLLTMTPPTPIERRRNSNSTLPIDVLGGESYNGLTTSPERYLRSNTADIRRPATSASDMPLQGHRRKSGAGGFRDRISAFTSRIGPGKSTGLEEDKESDGEGGGSPSGKKVGWKGRTQTAG